MGLATFYHYLIEEINDQRTKGWFLVDSPVPLALILLFYCYLIFIWGPNYMKNREPYDLRTYIKCYNLFQIIGNIGIVYGTATSGWLTTYSLGCQPLDTSPTGEGLRMATVVWWAYMIKLIDLSETMVYILRKKNRQISVLHVYHHISTGIIAWVCAKWTPGGMLSSAMMINCGVHVIMYSYYLLSTSGPGLRKISNLIKPWITIIQMTQFCILVGHLSIAFKPSCDVHKGSHAVVIADLLINLGLFYNFYKQNYIKKKVK